MAQRDQLLDDDALFYEEGDDEQRRKRRRRPAAEEGEEGDQEMEEVPIDILENLRGRSTKDHVSTRLWQGKLSEDSRTSSAPSRTQ